MALAKAGGPMIMYMPRTLFLVITITGCLADDDPGDDDSARVEFVQGDGIFHEQYLEGGFVGGEVAFDFIAGHPPPTIGLGSRKQVGVDADVIPYPNSMQPRKTSLAGLDKRYWASFLPGARATTVSLDLRGGVVARASADPPSLIPKAIFAFQPTGQAFAVSWQYAVLQGWVACRVLMPDGIYEVPRPICALYHPRMHYRLDEGCDPEPCPAISGHTGETHGPPAHAMEGYGGE